MTSKRNAAHLKADALAADPNFMTMRQAADYLGITHKELWRLCDRINLPLPICVTPRRCFLPRDKVMRYKTDRDGWIKRQDPGDEYTMSRRAAAAQLGVSQDTVSRMVVDKRLESPVKKGNKLFFRPEAVQRLRDKREAERIWTIADVMAYTGLTYMQIYKHHRRLPPQQWVDLTWLKSDIVKWWEACGGDPVRDAPLGLKILFAQHGRR